jgi:hypothetical protein
MELKVVPNFFTAGRDWITSGEASPVNANHSQETNRDTGKHLTSKSSPEKPTKEKEDIKVVEDHGNQEATTVRIPVSFPNRSQERNKDSGENSTSTATSPEKSKKEKEGRISAEVRGNHEVTTVQTQAPVPSPFEIKSKKSNKTISESEQETEETEESLEPDIVPPGTYEVRIELEQLWLQSRSPLTSDFTLSFSYAPLGIEEGSRVVCRAKRDPSVIVCGEPNKRCAVIYDGAWKLILSLTELTDALLREPIVIEIRHLSEDLRNPHFAVVKIPFGKVFFSEVSYNSDSLAFHDYSY